MRLIITLFVPATEIGSIKRMAGNRHLCKVDIFSVELPDEARNPLAFVHEGLNLIAAPMMGKPARVTFPGDGIAVAGCRSEE